MAGVVSPLRVNPVPLIEACEIVTLVPPLFVTVSETDSWLPTVTFPKLALEGFAVSCPAATPVPVNGIVRVGFVAFDVRVKLPFAAPAACGEKVRLTVVLCPPLSVTGVVMPLKLNPAPLIEACEIVTLVPPLFVIDAVTDSDFPILALPKASLDGLLTNCPAVIPVPERGIEKFEFEAFEVRVTLPLAAPVPWGANVTVKFVL